jgi:translation initiation factor IF-1
MVVTKSERKNRIRGAIDRIIKMLQGDKLIIEKRKLYVKILTAIA